MSESEIQDEMLAGLLRERGYRVEKEEEPSLAEKVDDFAAKLDDYNRRRPHRSIGRIPPMRRLLELQANNVVEAHT